MREEKAARTERFEKTLSPFVRAAESARIAMIFTDWKDKAHPVVFANNAFLELTGFTTDQIIGTPLHRLLGDMTDATSLASIRGALEHDGQGTWEMQCRRADRSEFLAAVFLSPIMGEDGYVQQCFLSIVEISGRIERLIDQRNELQALYEHAPGFIVTLSGPEHRITFANASYHRFVERHDLVGKTLVEALPGVVEQGFLDLVEHVYKTGEPFVGRNMAVNIAKAGSTEKKILYCDFVYQPVRNAAGEIIGLFCEGYDTTERHQSAETLARLQSDLIHFGRINALGSMATTLAHELNQPLSAIVNYSAGARRMLDQPTIGKELLEEALHEIESSAQRAADIISNIRDLTRRRHTGPVAFGLRDAIEECIKLMKVTMPPGIEIDNSVPSETTMVANRIQIQQVVLNLLRNASEAVAGCAAQQIKIGFFENETHQIVSVIDTGKGVSLEAAQNMFSAFHAPTGHGLGVGLSISQTIMESHRGRIWLEHSGPEGSEFRFSVPKAEPPEPQETTEPKADQH